MGALLQLERFDLGAEKPAPPPVFAQSDLEAAFAEGLAQGRQEAEAQRLGEHELGLRHRPFGGIDQQQNAVDHA